jgi:hypothetical protein
MGVVLAVLVALLVTLASPGRSRVAAGPAESFLLVPTWTVAADAYPKERIMAASQIAVDAIGHVSSQVQMSFDYIFYGANDPNHTQPLHTIGSGSMLMTGEYNPETYRMEGRFHLEYTAETTGSWMGDERRVDTYEGHFSAVVTGPNHTVPVTIESVWTNQTFTRSGSSWKLFGTGNGTFTETYNYRQVGGPLPPAAMATVTQTGNSAWISWDGAKSWLPLKEGDVLRAGCIIRTGDEGNPLAGGGRVILIFAKGVRYVVEPNSRVQIHDWGAQMESGSVEVGDSSASPSWTKTDNGFVGGKDPSGAQVPFLEGQCAVTSAIAGCGPAIVSAVSAGKVASGPAVTVAANSYRVQVAPEGMKVSVYGGTAYVKSTVSQAVVQLAPGQSVIATATGLTSVTAKTFTDVGPSDSYRPAIIGMARKGIVSGRQCGWSWQVRPRDAVKRAQFAKMIDGVMSIPVDEAMEIPFSDLGQDDPNNLYPHEYVAAAAANGITTGVRPGEFVPYDPIKRAQVVTMIVRAANQLWPGLLDTPPSDWAPRLSSFVDATHGPAMRSAEYNGLLNNLSGFGSSWNPWSQASRGEVAQMLWNLMTK